MIKLLLLCYVTIAYSQELLADSTKYIKATTLSFNLANTTISDNWYKGGNSSLSWNINAKYKFTTVASSYGWVHTGKFAFGKSELEGVPNPSRIMANELKHETVYTKKIGFAVEPFVSVSGQTQFVKGYNYTAENRVAISDFFDPAYFTQAIGIGYTSKDLTINARAGFSIKETIADTFALAETGGDELKVDKGLKLNFSYTKKYENFELSTAFEIFSELEAIKETDLVYDFTLTSNVTSFLKFSFDLDFRYDFDIHSSRQLMHVLSIGAYYDIF